MTSTKGESTPLDTTPETTPETAPNCSKSPKSPDEGDKFRLAKRLEATERERRRMKLINSAFVVLQDVLPCYSQRNRLPKYDCLRLAIRYIKDLRAVLRQAQVQPQFHTADDISLSNGVPVFEEFPYSGGDIASSYFGALPSSSLDSPVSESCISTSPCSDHVECDEYVDANQLQSTVQGSPSVSDVIRYEMTTMPDIRSSWSANVTPHPWHKQISDQTLSSFYDYS